MCPAQDLWACVLHPEQAARSSTVGAFTDGRAGLRVASRTGQALQYAAVRPQPSQAVRSMCMGARGGHVLRRRHRPSRAAGPRCPRRLPRRIAGCTAPACAAA